MDRTVVFGAVGDIAPTRQVLDEINRHGSSWVFEPMKPYLSSCDFLFGNMETIFLPHDFPEAEIDNRGLFGPRGGEDFAHTLHKHGFKVMNLAQNHVLDGGAIGLRNTKTVLKSAGIYAPGAGETQDEARMPAIMEINDIRFAFLCYAEDNNYSLGHTNPGPAYYTRENVLADISRWRNEVDILVISVHADIEFMPTPSTPRRNLAREFAKAGADIILQHHPHVPQGIEMIDGCLIAYSLGNFIFDARTNDYMIANGPHTSHSFLLRMTVSKHGVESFERIPFEIPEPPNQRPVPFEGEAREKSLAYLKDLDIKLQDDDFVANEWRKVARRLLDTYVETIRETNSEEVLEELIGRLFLVAENRSWVDEVAAMAKERWEQDLQKPYPHRRPNSRFQ